MNKASLINFFPALLLLIVSQIAIADELSSREDKFEIAFDILLTQNHGISGPSGSSLDMDSEYGWGFNIGYNINEHYYLSIDANFVQPSYTTINTPVTFPELGNHEFASQIEMATLHVNLIYYFFSKKLTPFIQFGAGNTRFDTNTPTASYNNPGCWIDVWFGEMCGRDVSIYTGKNRSYNLGGGIRWDFNEFAHMRLSYNLRSTNTVISDFDNYGMVRFQIGRYF